jgi:formylglycine-generating enzyme
MSVRTFMSVAAIAAVTGLTASIATAQIVIPTAPIGNPDNPADPRTGLGSVVYSYNIGTTEVTNAQYTAFLNAKAASDPFSLYNPGMGEIFGGIARSGSAGSFTYSTIEGRENNPVNFVSFWDTTRFANWLNNGQGNGDTETGAYELGGVTNPVSASVDRLAGAQWVVTSENEWYKAAYFQPASQGGPTSNYWLYPTVDGRFPNTQQANVLGGIGNTTPVGSFAPNFNGSFDMAGNVWEWNETRAFGSFRGQRGGSFSDTDAQTESIRPVFSNPTVESSTVGFRVAQISGPGTPGCVGDIADDFGSLGTDDQVSFGDFLALLGLIGPCPGGPGCVGDIADDFGTLGTDGQVSFGDFLALLGLIGQCP